MAIFRIVSAKDVCNERRSRLVSAAFIASTTVLRMELLPCRLNVGLKSILHNGFGRGTLIYNFGGDSSCNCSAWHIAQHDGICAHPCMRTDANRPQYLCSRSNVDMAVDYRDAWIKASSNSYLLKNEAIDTNSCIGMNYDAVWMGDEKASPNVAIQRDLRPSDNAPKIVA